MDELLNLLVQFRECLGLQMKIYLELLPVLDKEEELLMKFDVGDFEKVVTEKDQIVKRGSNVEERRLACLRRICFMMSYDARGQLPSLRTFGAVFDSYLGNVKTLVDETMCQQLHEERQSLDQLCQRYLEVFAKVGPRVRRNQQVLKKMTRNIERSLAMISSEISCPSSYDVHGKTKARMTAGESLSYVRVKA